MRAFEHEDTVLGSHCFSPEIPDGMRCKHCGGYPFDLWHWTLG